MAHFAQLDSNNLVLQVVGISNEMLIDNGQESETKGIAFCKQLFGDNSVWAQTSYNTRAGIYHVSNTNEVDPDQSKAFRKNFAGIGYSYDSTRNAFINPKPSVSPENEQYVTFDEFSCLWIYNPPQPSIEVTRV